MSTMIARCALLGAAIVLSARGARGDVADAERRDQARRSFGLAQEAFARHDYAAAASAFEQAAVLVPHAATWLNAAEAREYAGDFDRASEDCENALNASASAPNARSFQLEAKARLARLLPKVSTVEVTGPPLMRARVDEEREASALPAHRRLRPGTHTVVFIEAGRTDRAINVTLRAGETRTVDAASEGTALLVAHESTASATDPSARAATTKTAPGDREQSGAPSETHPPAASSPHLESRAPAAPSHPPTGTWIAFGVGGAFAVATATVGIMTLRSKSDFEQTPTQGGLDRFRLERGLTNGLLGAACASVAVGAAIWWLSSGNRSSGSGAASIVVSLKGAVARVSF